MSNFLLFGFKSCGKSYWGRRLAQEMSYPFIDTDYLLEELYLLHYGVKAGCREICQHLGEEGFRQLESLALLRLKEKHRSIIALGGGSVLSTENLSLLQQVGRLIYLKVEKEVLKERLRGQPRPSFFRKNNFEEAFEEIYQERLPLYERIPAYTLYLNQSEEKIREQWRKIDGQ